MIGLTVYRAGDPTAMDERVGVIAFNVGWVPHALVAAILGSEAGIGVGSGCSVRNPTLHLLGRAAGRPDRWQPGHPASLQQVGSSSRDGLPVRGFEPRSRG